jgi:putative ABC transport system permease protein
MDQFRTILSEFIIDLKAQKLRAFLTMFGIIWGTVAIIVLIGFGIGFKIQTAANMHGLGESISIAWPGKTTKPYQGFNSGRSLSFLEEDVDLLKNRVPEIAVISAEYSKQNTPVRIGDNILNPGITGIYPQYGSIRNINPAAGGRFIDILDIEGRKRVVVLGDEVKTFLFKDRPAVGEVVFVGEVPFTVIGVMTPKTQPSSYNTRDKDRIFIPATTFSAVFGTIHPTNFVFKPVDPTRSEEVGKRVREVLSTRYKFDPTDEDAVWIWDTAEFDKFSSYLFLAINIFLGLIGSFTLGVAGLGVANIMFIVVQERIKEIGVKRAVGARRMNIVFQFFTETFFIIFLGSSIGFLIAFGIIQVVQLLPIKEFVGTPVMSWEVLAVTVSVLGIVGLSAGLMPARRAANVDVVECLRT